MHVLFYLREGGVALYMGEWQVNKGRSPGIDTVELRFSGFIQATEGEKRQ